MRPHVPFALAALVLLAAPLASPAHAQVVDDRDKLAQTAMKFLAVGADPRSAALGDATTALTGGSDALFYNPAALAWQRDDADAMFSETRWIADIDYNHASASYRLGSLGVVGGSLAFADYGEMIQTVFDPTEGGSGYREVGTFSPSAFVAGVGFARAFSDRFAAGGQVKYAHQDFGAAPDRYDPDSGELQFADISEGVLAYDFGVFYRTGFESLNFALTARNFSREVEFVTESAQLPLALHIGVSMDLLDLTSLQGGAHGLVLAIDAENSRDYPEQLKVGAEYTFAETLALRAGYVAPADEQGISLGAGVRSSLGGLGLGVDYAYTDFGVFDAVHRVAAHLSF
ncbi:MAG TPA: PorV/PorQ family protein [Bacteroidetes bacterium]|nr:PorV/PorQ family protein [Bacteroidota bacterium]